MKMISPSANPDHVVDGEAADQETIIRLRPYIEEYVKESWGDFDHSDLFWECNVEKMTFNYQLYFYKEPKVVESKQSD